LLLLEQRAALARYRIARIDHGCRSRSKNAPFRVGKPLGRAHDFEVCIPYVGENGHVRSGDLDERCDVAITARAELDHDHLDGRFERKEQLADPEFVVLVRGRGSNESGACGAQDLRQQPLGRGLACTSGYGDDVSTECFPRRFRQG
jgi:hypothetical protein